QLRRERRAELTALLARWSMACRALAAVLMRVGIASVWHRAVPGAMCGTGVLQAMGSAGSRTMLFGMIGLMLLYAWQVLDRLNRVHPDGALTLSAARVLICAAPFLFLALAYAWRALMHIDPASPVSCCAAVYDRVVHDASASAVGHWLVPAAFWTGLGAAGLIALLAGIKMRFPDRGPGAAAPAAAIVWMIASSVAVKHVWSAYYYQVLSHPCPWCLFLPDYHGAGFLIYGSMAVVVLEGIALWTADRIRRRHPPLAPAAAERLGKAARRMLWALAGFYLLSTGPAVLWRLRTGVWLGG
ncbi:MAG TPA: hypothetical protein VLT88_03865, partial [Desulfosarcina sp.]|nr:hypothetical protein [Desulfosarcina sp.]